MKRYNIHMLQSSELYYQVDADTEEEAIEKAKTQYENGIIQRETLRSLSVDYIDEELNYKEDY